MFEYSKKIDDWSQDMIKGLTEIWGNKISKAPDDVAPFTIKYLVTYLDGYMKEYGQKIIDRFDVLMGKLLGQNNVSYYVNTTPVSLHNSSEFFVSIGECHSFISYPTVVIHEICHIYFYYFIRSQNFLSFNKVSDISELLTESQENELKEIITVILNLEFSDLINQDDQGYPDHQVIRRELQALWLEKPDFISWVSAAIKMYKRG